MWPNSSIDLYDKKYWLDILPEYRFALRYGGLVKLRCRWINDVEANPVFDLKVRPMDKLGNIKVIVDLESKSLSAKTRSVPCGPLRLSAEVGYSLKDRSHFFSWDLTTQWSRMAIFDRKETLSLSRKWDMNMKWSAKIELPEVSGDSRTRSHADFNVGSATIEINSVELSYDIAKA